jgi:septal ring factor EnvC (AmiA/AmiB activator)
LKKSGHKYRLAMLDDNTLREVFSLRIGWWGAISVITISFMLILVALSLLIVYTPLRNILPGYNESLRQQIITESARVDSLQTSLTVQRQYLDVIKQVVAGDIQTDSVQSLDSLQLVEREQILAQNSEVTENFKTQYEQKERDRLLLFDNTASRTVQQLFRPVRGVITQSARPDLHSYATTIHTAKNENVLATMRGTIVLVERMADNTFTVILQNNRFVTVYHHVAKVVKPQGSEVERGESIALMDGDHDLALEVWDAGKFVNPEEVMVR